MVRHGTDGKGISKPRSGASQSQPERRTGTSNDAAKAPAEQSAKIARAPRPSSPTWPTCVRCSRVSGDSSRGAQREQMLQSYEEQFLPKYEQLIADYFRSLTEEDPRKP